MNVYSFIKEKVKFIEENRKTLALIVNPDLTIIAKIPINADKFIVDKFIEKRTIWAYKQLEYFKQFQNKFMQSYISGSTVKYLGRQYMLKVIPDENNHVSFTKNRFYLYSENHTNEEYNKNLLSNWLYEKSVKVFNEEFKKCIANFNINEELKILIKYMDKKWGSYKSKTITLNPLLIMVDKKSIQYVITHEICHYYYQNHSLEFYSLLENKIPNWKQIKHNMELKILTYK